MIDILKNKKGIFFDMGWTLDTPASGDWMITLKAIEYIGKERLKDIPFAQMRAPGITALHCLEKHLLTTLDEEYALFCEFYSLLSEDYQLGLSPETCADIARDRTYNMDNYVFFPGVQDTLRELSKTHRLGIISDTWPSIRNQLEKGGITQYFSSFTFSCELGVWKPDERMYLDALEKLGLNAADTVFIDDNPENLRGAEKLGITPVYISAGPGAGADTDYFTIHSPCDLNGNS